MLRRIADLIDRELHTQLRGLVKLPRKPPPRAAILTPTEERALWDAAPAWMKLFIALALDLALRFSEARQISWTTLDPTHSTISVRTKGGSVKTFPVTPRIRALIEIAPTDTPNLLEGLAGRRISPDTIRAAWARLKKKANLPENLIPHDLRRTAAVRAYQATHDVFAAKALLGHEQIATTALYLRAHEPAALRALEQNWFSRPKPKEPTQ